MGEHDSGLSTRHGRSRRPHLQDGEHWLSTSDADVDHGVDLGKQSLGFLLELGSQGRLGADHVARLCNLSSHPHHARMEWKEVGILCNCWIWGCDVYVPRCHLFAARHACVCELDSSDFTSRALEVKL